MYNFGKTIIWFFGIMFLVFGGIALGQQNDCRINWCPEWQKCESIAWASIMELPTYQCVEIANTETTNNKIKCDNWEVVWIFCKCPDNTKNIDGVCTSCSAEWVCCGIKLNTNVPFIGNCIELSKKSWDTPEGETDPNETRVTDKTAFPRLMWWLTKILVTIIILAGFIGILAGWVMISASGGDDSRASEWRKLIIRVVIALALLGASGVILRLINPNFFG